ncbi:MAG: sigma-54 dependent transcriptional regulator [Desulfobacterales bacterium]|nr:sigma-54 dependent transcriptional regulator [Desulfobacterales bacterium]
MDTKHHILIVDDDPEVREHLDLLLQREGYGITAVKNGKQALQKLSKKQYGMVLSGVRLGDIHGLELLRDIKEKTPDTIVIMISHRPTTEAAVEAMNLGAYDFVPKSFDDDELKHTVFKAFSTVQFPDDQYSQPGYMHYDRILGQSPVMKSIYRLIEQIGNTNTNVLITGESGTGKELIARAIHENSHQREHPFVVVNCGGIPDTLMESEFFGHVKGAFTGAVCDKKGLFEAANRGTIFLDEIGELSPLLQVKLLRAVQETTFKPVGGTQEIQVDVRIISATNKELEKEVIEGNFREDLYFRLNVIPIKVPPLRDRMGDVEILSRHFVEKYSREMGKPEAALSSYAIEFLNDYTFPGNVRELENLIERSVALSSTNIILPESLTISTHKRRRWIEGVQGRRFDLNDVAQGVDLDEILSTIETAYLSKAMKVAHGNKKIAADHLNISLRSLRYRLSKNI